MSDLQRALTGAHRPSSNPRIHRLSSPYNRRSSLGLAASSTMGDLASLANGSDSPTKSANKPAPSSRVQSLSTSSGGMTRSGSESSLFSVAKSLFSRSFWSATPAKATNSQGSKRDSLSSFGHDLEDPESPSDRRDGKRRRRFSPEKKTNGLVDREGDYKPDYDVQGRAVSGYMLPSLAPHVTLKPKQSSADKPLPSHPTNFSRPLTSSQSMPYLDPPSRALRSSGTLKSIASPRKTGVLTRSKRVDLASLGNDELEEEGVLVEMPEKGKEKEQWSPWASRYAGATGAAASAAAIPRGSTPRKSSALTDYAMPSASPFRLPPASPRPRQSTSGLTRSATTANLGRQSSVVSDLSMASASRPVGRSVSIRNLREPESSSVFGESVIGEDDSMSIDGDSVRRREGSVLDWFMKDRWDKPGAPASAASSRRLTSAAPSSSSTIRKGQMVWNQEDKVFVRESELKAAQHPNPIHKNEAERILYTLEAMRKTPLTDARKGNLPPLLGQSSRTLRKTINVPLATAAAGESAKQRRDKERLGDSVSVMISPYGRRNVADREAKEVRRQSRAEDREQRLSVTPSDARSDTVSNIDMDSAASRDSRSPAPPTPRRSSRLKRGTTAEEESTPKASRRNTRRGNSKQPESIAEEAPTKRSSRRTRKTTVDRGTSPEPPAPVPEVPVITATAPSPGGPSSSSNYQPRAAEEMPRGSSSLRAKSDSKRAHQSAATYSRGQTPSSGRYSAKDEDLPDMEELEQASKISLPSFSGITFDGLSAGAPAPKAAAPAAPQPPLSLPRAGGPLARLGVASTRPRASSPLAGGSIVAAPDSPPSFPPPKKDDLQPPAGGIFPLFSNNDKPAEKPSSSLSAGASSISQPPASTFFSKPPTPKETPATEKPAFSFGKSAGETDGAVPDFFGTKSGSSTPAPAAPVPTFSFGVKKTTEEKAPPAQLPSFGAPAPSSGSPAPFTFGAPAAAEKKEEPKTTNGTVPAFSFGGFGGDKKEEKKDAAPSGGFNFGAPKESSPAPAASSSFFFGAPKPTESAAKPAFSFGAPAAEKPKADETPKVAFNFGAPAASAEKPAEKPAETAAAPFAFGTPTAPSSPAPKPAFSFGAASGTTTPAATPPPTFGAVKDSTTNGSTTPAAAPAFGGFNFSKPAEKPADKPASTFSFGAGGGDKPNGASSPFGAPVTNGDAAKNPFGGSSTPAASSTPSFSFGASSSTGTSKPAGAFGSAAPAAKPFSFGAPSSSAPAAAPANPFGTNNAANSSSPAFSFGASNTAAPAPNAFGSSAPTPNPFGQQSEQKASSPAPFAFGAPAPTPSPSTSTFGFGQPSNNGSAAPSSTFSFGQPSQPSAPSSSAPAFSFGAPAVAPAAAPFAFGAPAGDAASRFKSPTPGPDAAAGNGFSLGIAASEAPSSPGGRRVRGLPKRR
ncbi:hypothetical protein L202_01212 [Cryptococcus amylolentus CBS 6039]|uniref:Uncharacterized protein n=1 Tax=Cryptococcus amylolentus CBS 6039 TaxID=1295533 RepID=A0A1E3I539_9TREE|nr:hypothetical protein L202_01212 [Cryptococcus amylolentus CBS 6039]ODN82971.1 hypothetical protein L202_01212 [Cryptococcus amylolentus CBS 6039]